MCLMRFDKVLPMEQRKNTIRNIISQMNTEHEIDMINQLENLLVCHFAYILMYIGTFFNFIIRYFIWGENIKGVLFDSILFLILGILFTLIPHIKISIAFSNHIISLLYSLWFVFVFLRYYNRIGPAVWTLAFIQIILAMVRISRIMLIYMSITTFISGLYVVFNAHQSTFQVSTVYYVSQFVLFGILFLIAAKVHLINISKFERINQQYITVIEQKTDLEALYEEIAATDEELRQQNEQLKQYNEEIKQHEEHLNFLAYFDTLTELPNRKMVFERLNLLLHLSKQHNLSFYVVFIDIDHFKKVNDTMGHHCGDLFIQAVAQRLKAVIHEEDLLGRIGGDEFALVFQRDLKEEEAFQYVENIRKSFLKPFKIDNSDIRTTASFGISVYPQDGEGIIELLKSADTSMYKAKELGKNNVQFFKKGMKDKILKKIELENRLLSALHNDEFFLVFQPQFSAYDTKVRGFEALLRWQTQDLGVISPSEFIPLTEEMGLIIPLGEWVLKTACKKFKEYLNTFHLNVCLCVNISVVQMKDPNFINIVKAALEASNLDPKYLELEITESVFIESYHDTSRLLTQLKEMGIKIALDDFGTGYSSLSYLKLLPIDILKIDRTFVNDMEMNAKQIVGDIISLAHNLDISVIAEGVEYTHQLDYLKKVGCDCVQGFLLGRPLDEEALKELLTHSSELFNHFS